MADSIYKRFEDDDIVRANPAEVTTGIWTGDVGTLTAFFTSSVQSASVTSQYYYDIYQVDPAVTASADVQFSLAYGHRTGGGAPLLTDSNTATLAPQVIYSQYRNLLLDATDPLFTFYNNYDSQHIYVVNVARQRLRERFDPGNFVLTLSGSSGKFTFIDDSGQTLNAASGRGGQVFNLVSGSLTGVSGSTVISSSSPTQGGFGLVYPDVGLIVLNPDALKEIGAIATAVTASGFPIQYNHQKLLTSMRLGASFSARSAETISSTHYFVRLRNKEYNYSNNPTFFDGISGTILNNDFVNDPRTYITTIGLYNDNNELLAVAKVSKPVKKDSASELLLKVKLDW